MKTDNFSLGQTRHTSWRCFGKLRIFSRLLKIILDTHSPLCYLTLMKITKIKCAASWFNGKIYEGNNHAEIGFKMVTKDKVCKRFPGPDYQGFVTEIGDYVNRYLALKIAIKAGQVIEGKTHNKYLLFSEDLRKDLTST